MAKKRNNKKSSGKNNVLTLIAIVLFAMFVSPEIYDFANGDSDYTVKSEEITEVITEKVKEIKNVDKKREVSKKSGGSSDEKGSSVVKRYKDIEIPTIVDNSTFYYNHTGRFYVQYDAENRIPLYVSYILTRKDVEESVVDRSSSFKSDLYFKKMGFEVATNSDYTGTGYDRGHMLPSADRNDTKDENKATFLFSNITPQRPSLNRETLSSLERDIRELAAKYDSIYIVTGSILQDNPSRPVAKIGKGVSVPQYIYKVVAYVDNKSYKTVGFLMPNNDSVDSDYKRYAMSVDEIEKKTKIDFFHKLPDSIENSCEASFDLKPF